jgi:hypothetical protein
MRNGINPRLENPLLAPRPAAARERINDQGVALVITLLLLFLLSVVGLAAVLTSSSDLMINGYYRNFRGSFYAGDSGLNIARQAIFNYFNDPSNLPSGSSFSSPPSAATWAANAQTYINANFGNSYSLNSYGQASGSWAGSFKITATVTPGSGAQPSSTTDSHGNITAYTYGYVYTLTSVGSAQGGEAAQIYEQGNISVGIAPGSGTTGTNVSFSAFGAFIDSFSPCSAPLVPGYLTGPMYARGEWNFGSSGTGYTFTDPVSQTDSTFSYWPSSGGCVQSGQPKYGSVVPTFQSGYNLNSTPITLPANAFSQEWAVLDGKGCGESNGNVCGDPTTPAPNAPTLTQMSATLKDVTQTAFASDGSTTSGVFLAYTCSSGACTLNGDAGGIYVKGDASVTLSTSGSSGQTLTISQNGTGSNSSSTVSCTYNNRLRTSCTQTTTSTPTTYTTVTVDPTANTTTVQTYTTTATSTAVTYNGHNVSNNNASSNTGTNALSLTGVPHDLVTTYAQAATMLYVDGDITSLSGPSSGAAIQDNAMLTVVANGDVTVTGNITYKTKPVTTSANQVIDSACCNGDPIDTLIPAYQNMNQVLGIFTATGNFIVSPASSGANVEVDASIAMISQAGETNSNIGHMATGNSVGTFTNIGGRVENRAHSVSMNKSNVYFDRRFTARSNFAPPWFPSTTVSQNVISSTVAALPGANPPSRTTWLYKTAGQ